VLFVQIGEVKGAGVERIDDYVQLADSLEVGNGIIRHLPVEPPYQLALSTDYMVLHCGRLSSNGP
jgi:hypothetical protein